MYTGFWLGDLRERDHMEELDVNEMIILIKIFKRWNVESWTGLMWVRIGKGGGRLVNAVMNIRFP